jgi:hypothetical protein
MLALFKDFPSVNGLFYLPKQAPFCTPILHPGNVGLQVSPILGPKHVRVWLKPNETDDYTLKYW